MTLFIRLKAQAPIPLDLSFSVEAGQILALVGPSGSGKSTVLRSIAGLYHPEETTITVRGKEWRDMAPHKRRVGMVFQNYALFPHLTARGNVCAALDEKGMDATKEANRLLDLVGLGDMAERRPAELSGGQQQRVAIARALARKPDVLLLDEPFSAVDRPTRESLYAEIEALRSELSMPVVLVTHDMDEAQRLADRMAVIDQGRLVCQGSLAEVALDPKAMRVLGLRQTGAVLTAKVAAHDTDGITRLAHPAGALFVPQIREDIGTEVKLRLLAHDVMLANARPTGISALNILEGKVVSIAFGDGPGAMVHVDAGGEILLARITRRSVASLGLVEGSACFAVLKSLAIARDRVHR
ncbi:molybdenum ABC transporter ATP-binding protein [Marivivens sp. LCG002]|uniref:molybdenum ABC transporter ATP-binding protein n=1 Tax=Marivivens sp. LCG002 TaxID=3051171 RepID=UPI002552392E|nr:molybdenum ABC transporter ATP-binding protein [Marivivens sp. LCG002]WIV49929.1 molybdenum ABC transporter ATP-binding protein [Marivivens sp. LCG002]